MAEQPTGRHEERAVFILKVGGKIVTHIRESGKDTYTVEDELDRKTLPLRPLEEQIVAVLHAAGRRLTGPELCSRLEAEGARAGRSTIQNRLTAMSRHGGPLTSGTDSRGKGYGLREWTAGPA